MLLFCIDAGNLTLRLGVTLLILLVGSQINGQAAQEAQEFLNQELSAFLQQSQLPRRARLAVVMSRRFPSTETYDFQVRGGQYCDPSTDWNSRLQWNNGSCVDTDGGLHRFIEGFSEDGDVLYFRCDALGVSPRTLINQYHAFAIGNPDYGPRVSTKVIVKGREVGSFPGRLPNIFITGDLRHIVTDDGQSLYDRIRSGEGGILKLEVSQDDRHGISYYKFSLRGFKRAIKWCTANLDEM